MNIIRQFLLRHQLSLVTATLLMMSSYFSYQIYQGDHSYEVSEELLSQEDLLSDMASRVRLRRDTLEHNVSLMNSYNLDPDMLEEQVRKKLGYVHNDELVLLIQ